MLRGQRRAAVLKRRVVAGPVDTTPPSITNNSITGVLENVPLAYSLTANEAVTWSIRTTVQDAASYDASRFELSGSTLRFAGNATKDYEAPDDSDGNNFYAVVVRATDPAGNFSDQAITVEVTNNASEGAGNMLTNGSFTAPASEWTLVNNSGSSSISGGVAHFNDAGGDIDKVSQTVAGLTSGVSYTVTGTISNRTRGGILVALGGTAAGTSITANGAFSRTGTASSSGVVQFISSGGAVLDLDDVSCVPA